MMAKSRTRSILLELMLDIVIFAICAAVCIQIFALSESAASKSRAMTHFAIQAQTVAARYKSSGADVERIAAEYGATKTERGYSLFYDSGLEPLDASLGPPSEYACEFLLVPQDAASAPLLSTMSISATFRDKPILSMSVSRQAAGGT
jgi:hypothetical protein